MRTSKILAVLAVALLLGAASAALGSDASFKIHDIDGDVAIHQWGGLYHWRIKAPATADTSTIAASQVADSAVAVTWYSTTGEWDQPDVPRNIVLRIAANHHVDVGAGTAVLTGTSASNETITENFTITANTDGAVTGNKAFKTVSSLTFPAQDAHGVLVSIGTGVKLGAPVTSCWSKPYVYVACDGTAESTGPTCANSATAIESNTFTFNTAPNGSRTYDVLLIIPPIGVATGTGHVKF